MVKSTAKYVFFIGAAVVTLVEDNSILENNDKIAETFNNFFTSAVSNLNIPPFVDPSVEIDHTEDPILRILEQSKSHPSIVAINEKNLNKQFSFEYIPKSNVERETLNLDVSKASQDSDISTKIIKMNTDVFAEVLYNVFNRSLEVGEFLSDMKLANLTPVHEKVRRYDKGNYRPDSILSNLSKVFERCLHKQISDFFDTILSKYQCGFRKGHGAQHCLIALLEKWRESINRGLEFGILLTDLSKTFDCLPQDLFIAKLFAYGFDDKALRFIYDYLRHRKQKTRIRDSYSSWQ